MRTFILVLFALASNPVYSQFTIDHPYVYKSTYRNINIEQVHVFPDKITFDFIYESDNPNGGYRYSGDSYIHYVDFNEKMRVTGLQNADYTNYTYVKQGKKAKFSASFPFSYYALLSESPNSILQNTSKFPFLKVDLIECSESYRQINNIDEAHCFNFYGVDLGLNPDQVQALYLSGLLDATLAKGEFETTAAFTKRTSPDSLTVFLRSYVDVLEGLYEQQELNIMKLTPTIDYNADKETFSVNFLYCEPFLLKCPIAEAPAFKKAIVERTKTPASALVIRKANGKFYIKEIEYVDKGNGGKEGLVYKNAIVEDVDAHFQATVARVLAELKKIYPKGQVWK